MEAKELRIGNLVETKMKLGGSDIEKCRYKDDILCVNKYFFFYDLPERCKPIPLTEEWLLKFGFENNKIWYGNNEGLELDRDLDHYNIFLKQDDHGDVDIILMNKEIKYIHELQNLYLALTGKELECK